MLWTYEDDSLIDVYKSEKDLMFEFEKIIYYIILKIISRKNLSSTCIFQTYTCKP